ncbi:hypothetical protein E0L35_02155 [Halomonas sp. ATBC28]|nr:hypothetical protein E0L35_02155 [Halomonas sp. ATBC28]
MRRLSALFSIKECWTSAERPSRANLRRPLFAFPDLVDNVALTLRGAQGAYTLNLYRGREVSPFDDDDLVSLNVLVPLLANLIDITARLAPYHNAPRRQ